MLHRTVYTTRYIQAHTVCAQLLTQLNMLLQIVSHSHVLQRKMVLPGARVGGVRCGHVSKHMRVIVACACVEWDGREEEEGGARKTASVLARSETAGNYVG